MHTAEPIRPLRWESKIVRARGGEFAYHAHLQALLREEAAGGWMLAEVYSPYEVLLVRAPSAHRRDALLPPDYDPYRTTSVPVMSPNDQALHLVVLVSVLVSALAVMVVLRVFVSLP